MSNRNNTNKKYRKANKKNVGKNRPEREEVETDKSKVGANDASWYAANPELLRDSATMSFNNPLGAEIILKPSGDDSLTLAPFNFNVPGIMCLDVAPTIGVCTSWTDPVNIAARNIYSYVRHANSGHSNYDANDLMMYLLSADSVFSGICFMMRTYGLLRAYSVYNRYYPEAAIRSAGLDFQDFMVNMANFRYYINQYIVKAGVLCVPANMTYFLRHCWLYSHVWADATNDKAQTYIFNPRYFYQYSIGTSESGPQLVPKPMYNAEHDSVWKFNDLANYMNTILDSILVNETMNIMSGDILKAYGAEHLWHLASLPEDHIVIPEYNAEVLTQIHNASMIAVSNTDLDTHWRISQNLGDNVNRGCLEFQPAVTANSVTNKALLYDTVLDLPIKNPTPEDVIVASRLKVNGSLAIGAEKISLYNVCSDCIVNGKIWTYEGTGSDRSLVATNITNSDRTHISKFSQHPLIPVADSNGNLISLYGHVDNYTVLNAYTLGKQTGAALISMFTVPMMNTFVK